MKPIKNLNFNPNPYILILVLIFGILIWGLTTNNPTTFFTTAPIKRWNTIDPDVTSNGNTLRALTLLQTKKII